MVYAVNDVFIEELINDPYYRVYKNGSVWSCRPTSGPIGKIKHPWRRIDKLTDQGYKTAKYRGKELRVHRIVYRKYVGNLNPELEINHIDFNRVNNTVKNLELVTNKDNVQHTITARRNPSGEKNGKCKYSNEFVTLVRKDLDEGLGVRAIGRKYNIRHHWVSNIKTGKIRCTSI